MIEAYLLLSCHVSQLHSELHHFEFVEELVAHWRLDNELIHRVYETHHQVFTFNCQIKGLAVRSDQRYTLPGAEAILQVD